MVFSGSDLWVSPFATGTISFIMVAAGIITLVILLITWSEGAGETRTAKTVMSSLGLTAVLLIGLAITGFVMADQDRRQAQEALSAQIQEVYNIDLHPSVTPGMLNTDERNNPMGLYDLEQGGPIQMRENIGWVAVVIDGRDRSFRLSWNGEEWRLQDYHDENWHDLRKVPNTQTEEAGDS